MQVQVQVMLADVSVQIEGYGLARQLTLFEDDAPVLQVLTSKTVAAAQAELATAERAVPQQLAGEGNPSRRTPN